MQIVYFPYLFLRNIEEICFPDLPDIKVWNFDKKAKQYIPDEKVREKVSALLGTNAVQGRPISDIGVVSIGATDFRDFNVLEFNQVRELQLLLFLSALSKNNVKAQGPNGGWSIWTAENFEIIYQNFQLENDYISEMSGYIVRMGIGGYKTPEKKFPIPSYVIKPMRFALDTQLVYWVLKLKKKKPTLFKRILRATDLLLESYHNTSSVSENARALLQAGAFEILLDLPERAQRQNLKDQIEDLTNAPKDKRVSFWFDKGFDKKTGKLVKGRESRSYKGVWADRFYTLRNHTIHGEFVPARERLFYTQRHLDVATMFFVLLVKKLINNAFAFKKKIFFDEILWDKYEDRDGNPCIGFVYEDNDLLMRLNHIKLRRKAQPKKNH